MFINFWYHFFDKRPNALNELSGEEKEKLRKSLFDDIREKAGIPYTRISWIGKNSWPANRTWPYKMAAGFIIVLLALIPVFMFTYEDPASVPVEYFSSSNPAGQSSQITLTDGSVVWLSANSTLRYPERFENEYRDVKLEGEAFFDVSDNAEKPFIVNSAGLQTKVLGTSFNIRAFGDEDDIEITVVTGSVIVDHVVSPADSGISRDGPVALLNPDQQLLYNTQTRQTSTQTVDSNLYTSWKDGQLSFVNHSFEEIARRLERWYAVQIHFSDAELKQARFRITFENSSLQHSLRMLQAIKDFEFEIDVEERQIWIN